MATAAKIETTDIVVANDSAQVVLFERDKFDAFYAKLKADVDATPIDLKTDKGRKAIASAAAKVRTEKASIDRDRKRLTQEWRDMTAQVNGAWKVIEAQLDELAVEARKPLTEWEEAEKERIEGCRADIAGFKSAGIVALDDTAASVRARGEEVWRQEIDPARFGDLLDEAVAAKDTAIASLKAALARLTQEEADKAELEKLRAAQAEREAREAEELAAKEMVEAKRKYARAVIEHIRQCGLGMIDGKTYPYVILIRELEEKVVVSEEDFGDMAGDVESARRETLAAVKKAQADQAERLRKEAAEQAAAEAREETERAKQAEIDAANERARKAEEDAQRQRDEAAQAERERIAQAEAEAAEQARKEKNRVHRAQIMGEAKIAIMAAGSVDEAAAVAIVKAIVNSSIPHVTLRF